jgi:hypothetical protein
VKRDKERSNYSILLNFRTWQYAQEREEKTNDHPFFNSELGYFVDLNSVNACRDCFLSFRFEETHLPRIPFVTPLTSIVPDSDGVHLRQVLHCVIDLRRPVEITIFWFPSMRVVSRTEIEAVLTAEADASITAEAHTGGYTGASPGLSLERNDHHHML